MFPMGGSPPPGPSRLPPLAWSRRQTQLAAGLAIGIVAIAGIVWGALGLLQPGCSSSCAPSTPLGPCGLAIGSVTGMASAGNHSYAMLADPNGPIAWGSLRISLTDQNGSPVAPERGWVLQANPTQSQSGQAVASYDLQSNEWTQGSALAVVGGQLITLGLGPFNATGLGYSLVMTGPVGCGDASGQVIVSLP